MWGGRVRRARWVERGVVGVVRKVGGGRNGSFIVERGGLEIKEEEEIGGGVWWNTRLVEIRFGKESFSLTRPDAGIGELILVHNR